MVENVEAELFMNPVDAKHKKTARIPGLVQEE